MPIFDGYPEFVTTVTDNKFIKKCKQNKYNKITHKKDYNILKEHVKCKECGCLVLRINDKGLCEDCGE